jgi:hypothetical protein
VAFLKTFRIDSRPTAAAAVITCDNAYTLIVNERFVVTDADWKTPETVDLTRYLVAGDNDVLVIADNAGAEPNPAGLFFGAHIETEAGPLLVASDSSWLASSSWPLLANGLDASEADWRPAAVLGGMGSGEIRNRLHAALRAANGERPRPVRAAFMAADPLQLSLGRPNREQVVSTRPDALTTLQALDLTNGAVLADVLERGAAHVLARAGGSGPHVVRDVYARALSREPLPRERESALALLGPEPTRERVEDFLWAVFMLPEFQTVR